MCAGPEIFFIAQGVQAVGGLMTASDEARQYTDRAGQFLANAKEEMAHTSRTQELHRGAIRAAYGKQGVKLAGTAQRYIDEQIRQDERELLRIKYNADLQSQDELEKAKGVKRKGATEFFKRAAGMYDYADKQDIFKKGAFGTKYLGFGE